MCKSFKINVLESKAASTRSFFSLILKELCLFPGLFAAWNADPIVAAKQSGSACTEGQLEAASKQLCKPGKYNNERLLHVLLPVPKNAF